MVLNIIEKEKIKKYEEYNNRNNINIGINNVRRDFHDINIYDKRLI